MKAIVVDDSRATRMILKRALVQQGFEVVEAGDGKQALEELTKTGPVDLALVDWNMPVMTGYELVKEVRAQAGMNAMAIMMVTTESETSQVQKALDAGANEYVMKPFTDDVLKEKLLLLGFSKDAP
jgi:two-component system, chemotaxis family, chemotaxis protein CheY